MKDFHLIFATKKHQIHEKSRFCIRERKDFHLIIATNEYEIDEKLLFLQSRNERFSFNFAKKKKHQKTQKSFKN